MPQYVLVINPGSTSTKLGLFVGKKQVKLVTLAHTTTELAPYATILEQKDFRLQLIHQFLTQQQIALTDLMACVGRGGMMRPIPSGTYVVSPAMLADLRSAKYGEHASNLGAILADAVAKKAGCQAYIVDPVVVDELTPVAGLSGEPNWPRRSAFHALNQKAVARQVLAEKGIQYEQADVIVAHLGGGISIGAHQHGRVIDVNNGLDGEGPYSPTRTGHISAMALIDYIYQQQPDKEKLKRMITRQGGLSAYLHSTDVAAAVKKAEAGDQRIALILAGMVYQINKEIAAQASVLQGHVQRIILTGGLAHSQYLTQAITEQISWLAPVTVFPGEIEMQALNAGVQRVSNHETKVKDYQTEAEVLADGRTI